MKQKKESFSPIAGKKPEILILGTFPGNESLIKNQYYANGRNAFWRIMSKLLKMSSDTSYNRKKEILIKNKIALWDVLKTCERNGSLDSSIIGKTIKTNDFKSFFAAYPSIKLIFFNGQRARGEYIKRVLPLLSHKYQTIKYQILPSTSTAMARLSQEQKFIKWAIITKKLEKT